MKGDIPIFFGRKVLNPGNYDLVIFTGKIDELNKYRYGRLPYRSIENYYPEDSCWDCDSYGTINLPDHESFIRKANYRVLYQADPDRDWIQYQKPVAHDNGNIPMYPVLKDANIDLFRKYLRLTCSMNNIMPAGRLGLYNYLNMDSAVKLAMDMKELAEEWGALDPEERYNKIIDLIGR